MQFVWPSTFRIYQNYVRWSILWLKAPSLTFAEIFDDKILLLGLLLDSWDPQTRVQFNYGSSVQWVLRLHVKLGFTTGFPNSQVILFKSPSLKSTTCAVWATVVSVLLQSKQFKKNESSAIKQINFVLNQYYVEKIAHLSMGLPTA